MPFDAGDQTDDSIRRAGNRYRRGSRCRVPRRPRSRCELCATPNRAHPPPSQPRPRWLPSIGALVPPSIKIVDCCGHLRRTLVRPSCDPPGLMMALTDWEVLRRMSELRPPRSPSSSGSLKLQSHPSPVAMGRARTRTGTWACWGAVASDGSNPTALALRRPLRFRPRKRITGDAPGASVCAARWARGGASGVLESPVALLANLRTGSRMRSRPAFVTPRASRRVTAGR